MNRILVTDLVHKSLISGLENRAMEVDYIPDISYAQVLDIIENYEGIVINTKVRANQNFLDKSTRLQWIARLGSGMEIIDIDYARSKGIFAFNSPEGNRNAVAEHTIGLLLTLSNKILSGDRSVRQGIWNRQKHRGFEIKGKTIGVIGGGNTGKAFVKKLAGFECDVLVYDKYVDNITFKNERARQVELPELQKLSQIISFHVPYNEETHFYFNQKFVDKCLNPFVIINTSRGRIVDTMVLIKNLENAKLTGACLDVFENEKPEYYTKEERKMYSRLFDFENVVLSPHVAGWTQEALQRIATVILNKLDEKFKF